MTTVKEKYELSKDSLGRSFISLTSDYLFKETFGSKRNHKFLEALLESYFNYPEGYLKDKLTFNYEFNLDKNKYLDKNVRSDIMVYFDNMIVNIEMHKVFTEESFNKSKYYIMRININQVEVGNNYQVLNKITQINFINEDKIGIEEHIESNTSIGPEPASMDFIHIDKPEKYLYNQNIRFYKFLKIINAKSYEERDLIAKGDEILMDLNAWLKDYCRNGDEKFLNDVYWNERIQRCEGRKEGIEEGENNKAIKIAKKMLAKNKPLEEISEITDLSMAEIKKLKNEITTEM